MTFGRRLGPLGRFNRRGLGSGGSSWRPTSFTDLDLWLRADLGLTTVDAAVASPNDLSTASWTRANCTATADTLTDSNDGAPAIHYAYQAVSGAQANHSATFYAEVKAGTLAFAALQGGAGDNQVNVNLTTGAVATVGAGVVSASAVDVGGGYWGITLVGVSAGTNYFIITAKTTIGTISYQGDGTGTIYVRNISVTQRNASAWADQSGQAHHVTQATGANQPLVTTASDFNGQAVLTFDGTNDALSSANVDWTGVTGCTVFAVFKPASAVSIFGHPIRKGEPSVSRGFELQQRNDLVAGAAFDNATANYYGTAAATYPTPYRTPHIASMTVDPSQAAASEIAIWMNGFSQTMSAVSSADTTSIAGNTAYTIGGRAGAFLNGSIAEIIVYKRVLTTAERRRVELYLAERYNILTDQRPMTAPTQYTGNVLWLRADMGITKDGSDRVSAWADQSGGGLFASVLQATGANQPLYVASSALLGSKPAIYLDGGDDFMASAGGTMAQPNTVLGVGYITGTANNQYLADTTVANTRVLRFNNATAKGSVYAGTASIDDGAMAANTPYVLDGVFSGAASSVAVNGVRSTGNPGTGGVGTGFTVGSSGGGADGWWAGGISEVVAYNRALSTAELLQVERYLGARYGITVA